MVLSPLLSVIKYRVRFVVVLFYFWFFCFVLFFFFFFWGGGGGHTKIVAFRFILVTGNINGCQYFNFKEY